jgi:DNA-binding response OmpR family regulator
MRASAGASMQADHHSNHSIVIVDDLSARRQHLVDALQKSRGMSVDGRSLDELCEIGSTQDQDTVLIDTIVLVAEAGEQAQEASNRLRAVGFTQPLLVLCGEGEISDDEADEMIRLPVQIGFLLSRIRAHISLYESSGEAILALGSYQLRAGLRQLVLPDGSTVRLTEKEINILRFLHRANGQPVSRDVLLAEIWGYNSQISTHTLETHIYRLRQKSEGGRDHPLSQTPLLVTDPGGYRLAI